MQIVRIRHFECRRNSVFLCLAVGLFFSCNIAAQHSGTPKLEDYHAPAGSDPWRDIHQTPECRVLELIQAMSLAEKIEHLGVSFRPQKPDRFGIPALNPNDGPNGYAMGPFPGAPHPSALGVTAFPNEIALAATWNRDLASEYGAALAEEWRAKGSSEIIAPTLNIMRTWHWGRSAETFGEDPFLNGQLASAEVEALQRGHVIAMIKHFAANNQDWDRVGHFPDFTGVNEIISDRALHEIYFPGFREAIQKAGAAGIMCAYNQINGVFACNNEKLLSELNGWEFRGAVTPDAVFALHDPILALKAGVTYFGTTQLLHDFNAKGILTEQKINEMLYGVLFPIFRLGIYDNPAPGTPSARATTPAHQSLAQQMIEESAVLLKNNDHLLPIAQERVRSIAVIGIQAGPQGVVGEEGPTVYVNKLNVPAEAIASRAGPKVNVSYHDVGIGIRPLPVLKGDFLSSEDGTGHGLTGSYFRSGDLSGTPAATRIDAAIDIDGLPAKELGPAVRSFGPPKLTWSARWAGTLLPPTTGEYAFSLDGSGSARLLIDGQAVAQFERVNFRTSAFGMTQLTAGKKVHLVVEHSNDYAVLDSAFHLGWQPPEANKMHAALDAAKSADMAIVFAGDQLGEGMDKASLELPGNQNELIEAVASQNPRTVVVLNTSTPVSMPWLDKVGAVLEAWYSGQESGAGISAVLFGDADPGGRLPMTFPADAGQGPATRPNEYPGENGTAQYDEGILVGYRWYDQHEETPLFPFGHGLSYATFEYSDLRVSHVGKSVAISVSVKNTGSRKGSDVVQVYVGEPKDAQEPPLQLKGFEKVSLRPGEGKVVRIEIPLDRLAAWSDDSRQWKLWDGTYRFKIGESSRRILLESSFDLHDAAEFLR